MSKQDLIDAICNLTLLEAADIVKQLEEKLGVSAAAPMGGMMPRACAQVRQSLICAPCSTNSTSICCKPPPALAAGWLGRPTVTASDIMNKRRSTGSISCAAIAVARRSALNMRSLP